MIAAMCAHVVVAEDDDQQAELIRRYLEWELHVVDVVGDGRSAVKAVRAGRQDLVVLDLMLPEMSVR
jgi:DNA-binding response OmpR family regulator